MIDVIQIFKSVERFKKDDYDPAHLQLLNEAEDRLISRTGYLADQVLYLPDTGQQLPGLQDAHTVIIQDINGFDPLRKPGTGKKLDPLEWYKDRNKNYVLGVNAESVCFARPAKSLTFEIFRIEKNEPGIFSLYLNYAGNQFAIGIPERDDHKIATIKLNQPVRYRVNGKSDFTMSGRKQRTFAEYDYLIEYVGQAEKIVFKELNKLEILKIKPGYKLVDERKILK